MDEARQADLWWEDLPDDRKVQIHRWISPSRTEQPLPGQTDLFLIEEEVL